MVLLLWRRLCAVKLFRQTECRHSQLSMPVCQTVEANLRHAFMLHSHADRISLFYSSGIAGNVENGGLATDLVLGPDVLRCNLHQVPRCRTTHLWSTGNAQCTPLIDQHSKRFAGVGVNYHGQEHVVFSRSLFACSVHLKKRQNCI